MSTRCVKEMSHLSAIGYFSIGETHPAAWRPDVAFNHRGQTALDEDCLLYAPPIPRPKANTEGDFGGIIISLDYFLIVSSAREEQHRWWCLVQGWRRSHDQRDFHLFDLGLLWREPGSIPGSRGQLLSFSSNENIILDGLC